MLAAAVMSRNRNIELCLLAGSAAFALLAWRALDAAAFPLPGSSGRILTQFLVTALVGHLALRLLAPAAPAVTYATALMLTAIGLSFVLRLAPASAQDQANWVAVGVALMACAIPAGRRYPVLQRYRYSAAGLALAILLFTGLFGTTINGARLWVTIGNQAVQTTEFIKVLVVLFLAGYLAREGSVLAMPSFQFGNRRYSALPYLVPLLLAIGGALLVLLLLRDLGSIAILLALAVATLYMATGRKRFVLAGALLLGVTGALGYVAFDHAQVRIDAWLDPYADPSGSGYQTLQSIYAVQAGGVTGAGLGLGSPGVIPAAPTDYVFAAIAEELGLAGAAGIAGLYVLFLFAGLRTALEVRDTYGRLLAASIALLVAIQAAVIIAGNLRLIPTTGITLPFVSYGGSSLVVNFILVGLLLGVAQREADQRTGQ